MDEGPFQNSTIHESVIPTYALGAGPVLLWEREICSAMYDPTCSTHRPPVPSALLSTASLFRLATKIHKDKEGVY